MEMEFTDEAIIFEKELNQLDMFALDFTLILDAQGIRYCHHKTNFSIFGYLKWVNIFLLFNFY